MPTHSAPPTFGVGLDTALDFAPWRLSGTVLGPLLNDPAAVAALGEAVRAAPYKAAPRAPVLGIEPRHTLAASGAVVALPAGAEFEIGATLGMVIGRTACRVRARDAVAHLAGWVLVADLSVPAASHYRPNVRGRARNRSCLVGAAVGAADAPAQPAQALLRVSIDGLLAQEFTLEGMQRGPAQLLQDVSEFMTLHPGDVLLLGFRHGAPRLGPGQRFAVECEGLGSVEGRLVVEPRPPEPARAAAAVS